MGLDPHADRRAATAERGQRLAAPGRASLGWAMFGQLAGYGPTVPALLGRAWLSRALFGRATLDRATPGWATPGWASSLVTSLVTSPVPSSVTSFVAVDSVALREPFEREDPPHAERTAPEPTRAAGWV